MISRECLRNEDGVWLQERVLFETTLQHSVTTRLASSGYVHLSMTELSYRESFAAEEFLALAQRIWPRDYSLADAIPALSRTINVGAWDGLRLVGSIRILTDGYFFATIPEILVDPEYQRRGIGQHLMKLALERAPRGKLAFAAQPQSVAFFDRIGCERKLTSFVATGPLKAEIPEAAI
ncbi:MAG TPA: GNAT family N-acetyltransferase [Gemmatimonadaceae bacterium]|nr:GNAT family N-acetyltransferase [Gemmatimonadaceae bacterium]